MAKSNSAIQDGEQHSALQWFIISQLFWPIWVSNQIFGTSFQIVIPKMVGTNHLSVEDVQIDKACVFRQKKIKLSSFNHYSQIKPKYSPEPTTLSCQIYDLKEIFAKINEHSHEWNFDGVNTEAELVEIMLWGNNANNRRGKRRHMMKYWSWDAPCKNNTGVNNKNKCPIDGQKLPFWRISFFRFSSVKCVWVGGGGTPFSVKKFSLLFWENLVCGVSVTGFFYLAPWLTKGDFFHWWLP